VDAERGERVVEIGVDVSDGARGDQRHRLAFSGAPLDDELGVEDVERRLESVASNRERTRRQPTRGEDSAVNIQFGCDGDIITLSLPSICR